MKRNKEIVNIIDKLVDNAVKKYGAENKKTITITENAEKLKQQYTENSIKLF